MTTAVLHFLFGHAAAEGIEFQLVQIQVFKAELMAGKGFSALDMSEDQPAPVRLFYWQISSFGHFQAKQHGVAHGSSTGSAVSSRLRQGLCLTRLSVTKLNHLVTDQLVRSGVPAVGISPFGTWKTAFKNVSQAGIDTVKDVLDSGYVPVLHGDCALDLEQHCCILSGDAIIEILAQKFSPRRVVFLTDVNGVYSRPPDKPGARLVNYITIGPDGNMEPAVLTSVLPHDTTGGVSLKLQAAVNIVSQSYGRIPVLICKLDSEAAERACLTGELEEGEGTKLFFKDI